jgi:hypothetical protein
METTSYHAEDRHRSHVPLLPIPDEFPVQASVLSRRDILSALRAWIWSISQLTLNYGVSGMDTFTWGDQLDWIDVKGIEGLLALWDLSSLFEGHENEELLDALVTEYVAPLYAIEGEYPHRRFSVSNYMRTIETWAEAYDQEAAVMSPEELEALYDDTFLEAMDLKMTLP